METELLKNQLQNIRNHLTTLSGNIDNTLLIYNEMSRNRTRAENRTNLNNITKTRKVKKSRKRQ